MTGASPPLITVELQTYPAFTTVQFRAGNTAGPKFTISGHDRVTRALEELDSGLLKLKDGLPELTSSDADLSKALLVLRELGHTLLFSLFGNSEDILTSLREFWRAAAPFARNTQSPPHVICISDANTTFPLEYLPLLVTDPVTAPASREDVLDQFRSFIGFSCIVQRKMRSPAAAGSIELKSGAGDALPVRYLHYDTLPGACQELEWFTVNAAQHVKLEGPYPRADATVSLAQQIYDPTMLLTGGRRDTPDQIQHFSCHCYTKSRSPLDSEIELSGNGQSQRLQLRTLGKELVDMTLRTGRGTFDLPLVFLNACGSARLRADGAFSFPQLFLDNKNRGFIGTEIEMPDDVASGFSGAFYERFLMWHLPLGRSMLEARRHLLFRHGNPLGIAYIGYADPELHVGAINTGGQ